MFSLSDGNARIYQEYYNYVWIFGGRGNGSDASRLGARNLNYPIHPRDERVIAASEIPKAILCGGENDPESMVELRDYLSTLTSVELQGNTPGTLQIKKGCYPI
jgi:hypothetical protein